MIKNFVVLLLAFVALFLPYPVLGQTPPQVGVSFSPASISGAANSDITVEIKVNPSQAITAQVYTINATFDTSKLELKNITYLVGQRSVALSGDGNSNLAAINSRQSPAEIRLIGEVVDPEGFPVAAGQNESFVRLTFTVKAAQQTTVNIAASSNIIEVRPDTSLRTLPLTGAALTVNQEGPTAPPSPTAPPTQAPTAPPAAPVCNSLTLPGAGLTPGPDNSNGGKSYTVSSNGATSPISVTRTPANAAVEFTPTTESGSSGQLTVTRFTDGTGWSLTIPPNSSTTANRYTLAAKVTNADGQEASCNPVTLTVGSAPAFTKFFKIAESPTDLAEAQWQPYTGHPMSFTHTLASPLRGGETRVIHVQFQSSEGVDSAVFNKTIVYTPDPRIANLDCHQAASGVGTNIVIKGSNFGAKGKGKVKVGGNEVDVTSWNDQTDTINLTLGQRLEGKTEVTVEADDGRSATANCSIDTTFLEFETKTQCKLPGQFAVENVEVKVFELVPGIQNPEPLQRQKIRIGSDGKPQGFAPKFEKGKKYAMIIKGQGMLAKKVEFKSEAGTTILDPISLAVGDIAPANSPDGKINAFDKSELIRQWSLATDVSRSGDFNGDSRINSIDYACMRQNFNSSDEVYTPPSPTPSPSVSPSGSATSSASPSPTPTPTAAPVEQQEEREQPGVGLI